MSRFRSTRPLSSQAQLSGLLVRVVAVAVAAVVGVGLVGQRAADAAAPVPKPKVGYSTAPEPLAKYVGQFTCATKVPAGTAALRQLILDTYGPSSIGTLRGCGTGGRSEHKDGRAIDWMLDVNDIPDRLTANAFLGWLIGPDAQGEPAGNARRLGVMYIIWNKHSWNAYDRVPGWTPYTGVNPHTDHIHLSLSWDGAVGRTSFWTGKAVSAYDYGPCQVFVGEPAEPGPHYEKCSPPRQRPAQAFPRWWDAGTTADVLASSADGRLLLYPGSGKGGFGRAVQVGNGWQGMDLVTAVGDLDRDGRRDLVARDAAGNLYLYRGNGSGGFLGTVKIGNGWQGMDVITGAGDLDLDGVVDLVARRAYDGALLTYPGNGKGGVRAGAMVGSAATADLVQAVGDWNGDGRPDLVSRTRSSGALLLHAGDGRGGMAKPVQVGRGWAGMSALVGPGDFDGDGRTDLLARTSAGALMLYSGNGSGGFARVVQVGSGWSSLRLVS